jgi:hypothetical protein
MEILNREIKLRLVVLWNDGHVFWKHFCELLCNHAAHTDVVALAHFEPFCRCVSGMGGWMDGWMGWVGDRDMRGENFV